MGEQAGSQFVKFTPERLDRYQKAGYRIIGHHMHSGIEICRWTKTRMRGERNCYKSVYGIRSHRCIQMTPTLDFCTFSCQFCWRSFGPDRFRSEGSWDSPEVIVEQMIEAQRKLLVGFGGNPKTPREVFEEAMEPSHVAISLDGEPTLYPHLPELIREIKSRGMTAFLVTNGTMPHRLKELLEKDAEPTNLYISVYASNSSDYQEVTRSFVPDAWDRVQESLGLIRQFKSARTIFRMTLVRGLNLKDPVGYSNLISRSEPGFVELKGYSWLGESKKRLAEEAMPNMSELEDFSDEVARLTGYEVKARDKKSRVIVMVKDDKTWRWSLDMIREQDRLFQERNSKLDENFVEGRKCEEDVSRTCL